MINSVDINLRRGRATAKQETCWALPSSKNCAPQIEQEHSCRDCEHYRGESIPAGLVLVCFCMVVFGAACWGYFLGMMAGR